MIKKILISQPKPASDKSPYYDIAEEFGVELVFRPFIKVEGLSSKEFREQKVSILNYSAVVFTSRHAIDNFFGLSKEMRLEIPDFGTTGKIADLIPTMAKHKAEKYLIPMSNVHDDSVKEMLDAKKLQHTECVMYRTISNDFTEEEKKNFDYDMCIFFSPSGINAFKKTFGDERNDIAVATFGPSTAKAAHEANLKIAIEAPSEKHHLYDGCPERVLREKQVTTVTCLLPMYRHFAGKSE